MSLQSQVASGLVTLATAVKTLRNFVAPETNMTTTAQTVTGAVNELKTAVDAAASTGGATNLDQLTDVTLAAQATGHILRRDADAQYKNVDPLTYFDAAGSAAAAQAASQPLDSDLTAIAGLTTSAVGRNVLTAATQAALTAMIGSASTTAAGIAEAATDAEALAGTDPLRYVTPTGLSAAINALVAGAPGLLNTLDEIAAALGDDPNFASTITTSLAGKQPLDATLSAIATQVTAANKIIYATGVDTFAVADFSAFGRTLVASADAAAARTSLDVFSKTEIGDVNYDFSAAVTAALA